MISDERLEALSDINHVGSILGEEIAEIAKELLAHRKAWSEPDGWLVGLRDKIPTFTTDYSNVAEALSCGGYEVLEVLTRKPSTD